MMKKSEILKLMNDIVERMPLSMENESDGRYTWPARWKELFDQVENCPKGTSQPSDEPCKHCIHGNKNDGACLECFNELNFERELWIG